MSETENTAEQEAESLGDAISAVCAILIAVGATVYWVSNQ